MEATTRTYTNGGVPDTVRKPVQSEAQQEPKQGWVPAWMVDLGVPANGAVTLSKTQLRTQQRPDKLLKVRLWATGMLHTSGYQGQEATTMRKGKKTPLTSGDVIAELFAVAKEYYQSAGIQATDSEWKKLKEDKEHIRRRMADLEDEGVALRTDRDGTPLRDLPPDKLRRLPSGHTRMFFWVTPRAADPALVLREWQQRQPPAPEPDAPKNPEVPLGGLPLPPISHILKGLKIGDSEAALIKGKIADPEYQKTVERAWRSAREIFLEVATAGGRQAPSEVPPQVAHGGGAFEILGERYKEERTPAPRSAVPPVSSSSSVLLEEKNKTNGFPKAPRDDDETPAPAATEYADGREHLKAIYLAKTNEHISVEVLDRIEAILTSQGKTFEEFADALRPHLGGNWKVPAAFLTDKARRIFSPLATAPQLKPKPKCPTCKADNQRGAILKDGAIVPCPDCSTEDWRAELTAKLDRRAKGATG